MYLRDVISQLRKEIPKFSDKFTNQLSIVSSSFSGGVVTIVTASAHGLETNDIVNVVDCQEKVPITNITTISDVATVTTSIDHDQTLDYQDQADQPPIGITESSVLAYNGSFSIKDILSRTSLTFDIAGSPAVASDGFLLRDSVDGYSGIKEITVIDATTFTFTTTKTLTTNGNGGVIHSSIRVSGDVDIERFTQAYSKQGVNEYWLAVIPESTTASKSRNVLSDATEQNVKGDAYRQKTLPIIEVYMFIPTSNEYSGRSAYDSAIDESIGLFKSLLAWRIPSPYSIKEYASVIFENHQPYLYNTAYYIHRFQFSTLQEIVCGDLFVSSGDVAFRDIDMNMTIDGGTENTQTEIELDQ